MDNPNLPKSNHLIMIIIAAAIGLVSLGIIIVKAIIWLANHLQIN